MNKLPAKQIYLLTIIIVGIIALSVYSTYALFTFESSTSDIVSIHTPKSLKISENVYEYNQITIEANTIITTDIDIYNSLDHEVCYSIWYKVIGDTDTQNKVQIFENSEGTLTSSGVLQSLENLRVPVIIINDNDEQIKVNLGTIGSSKEENSCSLNLSSDKKVINLSYSNFEKLTTKLLEEKDTVTAERENYLTYKDITDVITYNDTEKIYVSDKFEYSKEIFTLTEPVELTLQEFLDKEKSPEQQFYFCKTGTTCSILYKITEIEIKEEEKKYNYNITKYDKLIGYSESNNGLRKVNEKDYIYYGDNPNNFVYYNCLNNADLTTCELWRIVGFFYDETTKEYITKIVRNDSIGKYQFDYQLVDNENKSTNVWNNTTLYKYLNEEYKFVNNYEVYILDYKQEKEIIPNLEVDVKNIKVKEDYFNSKVNLLNLSDYLYASTCKNNKINEYTEECLKNNWLNNIEISKEWTLTAKTLPEITEPIVQEENVNDTDIEPEVTDEENVTEDNIVKERIINYIYGIGKNITEADVNELLEVRPTIYLKSRMLLLDGNGTLESPYVIK